MSHLRKAALPPLGVLDSQRKRSHRQHAIQQAAQAALRRSGYLAIREVDCQYDDGVLTLRGPVPSFFLKQMAQSTVSHQLRGGAIVDNQLEVTQFSTGVAT